MALPLNACNFKINQCHGVYNYLFELISTNKDQS